MVPGEGGGIAHAQPVFGNGMVMLGSARDDAFGRMQAPMTDRAAPVSQSPYIVVCVSEFPILSLNPGLRQRCVAPDV